ncbi:hypothetical protein EV182_007048 [Spiromyces aspiralis]|uniref:Uncharacterized protein n=1 Tax=Spiromyces aspiralis TaxID=68401 RepID=A0ACC1HPE5_9FUNG|nr:hypothetical protein EV182_007048 [Spiromyces aspiralis]
MVHRNTSPSFIDILGDIPYKPWSQLTMLVLEEQGVDKCVTKPMVSPTDEKENRLAMAIIFKRLNSEMRAKYAYYTNAYDLWERIKFDHDDTEWTVVKLINRTRYLRITSMSDITRFIEELNDIKSQLEVFGLPLPDVYYQATLVGELPCQMGWEAAKITHAGLSFNQACELVLRSVRQETEKAQIIKSKSKPKGDWDNKPKSNPHSRSKNEKKKYTKGRKPKRSE